VVGISGRMGRQGAASRSPALGVVTSLEQTVLAHTVAIGSGAAVAGHMGAKAASKVVARRCTLSQPSFMSSPV